MNPLARSLMLVSIIAGFYFIPFASHAVTVGPAKIDVSIDPGQTAVGEIYLANETGIKSVFYSGFEKFIEKNNERIFLPGEPTDLTSWFKMPQSVTLEPGEDIRIPYEIVVPEDAPPGGHFAIIWWSTNPPGGPGGARIVTRAGIVTYIRVSGEIIESANVLNFKAEDGKRFFTYLPINFNYTFENNGNVHLKPGGDINIKNLIGLTRDRVPVNEKGFRILPRSERSIQAVWQSDRFFGLALGFYRAQINAVYGEEGKIAKSSFWMIVFPWKHMFGALLILAIIFWIATKGIRMYNKWVIAKATAGIKIGERKQRK